MFVHMYVPTRVYKNIYMCLNVYTPVHKSTSVYIYSYSYVRIFSYLLPCVRADIYTHVQVMDTCAAPELGGAPKGSSLRRWHLVGADGGLTRLRGELHLEAVFGLGKVPGSL